MSKVDLDRFNDFMVEYKEAIIAEYEKRLQKKDEEIERLKEMKLHTEKYASEMEDKYILEKTKNDKAIEILGEWTIFETSACTDRIISETLDTLKGVDK